VQPRELKQALRDSLVLYKHIHLHLAEGGEVIVMRPCIFHS
jgi:hypothetical protein